jgi:hypothetical protein
MRPSGGKNDEPLAGSARGSRCIFVVLLYATPNATGTDSVQPQ